jgi:hypothetical protein
LGGLNPDGLAFKPNLLLSPTQLFQQAAASSGTHSASGSSQANFKEEEALDGDEGEEEPKTSDNEDSSQAKNSKQQKLNSFSSSKHKPSSSSYQVKPKLIKTNK